MVAKWSVPVQLTTIFSFFYLFLCGCSFRHLSYGDSAVFLIEPFDPSNILNLGKVDEQRGISERLFMKIK